MLVAKAALPTVGVSRKDLNIKSEPDGALMGDIVCDNDEDNAVVRTELVFLLELRTLTTVVSASMDALDVWAGRFLLVFVTVLVRFLFVILVMVIFETWPRKLVSGDLVAVEAEVEVDIAFYDFERGDFTLDPVGVAVTRVAREPADGPGAFVVADNDAVVVISLDLVAHMCFFDFAFDGKPVVEIALLFRDDLEQLALLLVECCGGSGGRSDGFEKLASIDGG